jgi:hypothetical protein
MCCAFEMSCKNKTAKHTNEKLLDYEEFFSSSMVLVVLRMFCPQVFHLIFVLVGLMLFAKLLLFLR